MPNTLAQAEKLTFSIVDDHAMVLGGTLNILKQKYPEVEIVTASTAQEALRQVEQAHPNLVITEARAREAGLID